MTGYPATAAPDATDTDEATSLVAQADVVLRRLRLFRWAGPLLASLASLSFAVWVLVVIDAVWPISSVGRSLLLALYLIGAGVAVARCVLAWRRLAPPRLHAAVLIDGQAGRPGQPVANAISLQGEPHRCDPLAETLRRRAIRSGSAAAVSARPASVVPRRRLLRPASALGLSLLLWAITAIGFPTLPALGIERLIQPGGDTPPFSLTAFDVEWTPSTPEAGASVRVRATAQGRIPERVTAVILDKDGRPHDRIELKSDGALTHRFTLYALREPVTFHLEAFGRRTQRYTITPLPADPSPPEPLTRTQPEDPASEPGRGATDTDDPPPPPEDDLPGLMGRLAGLVSDLAALSEQARQLGAEDSAAAANLEAARQALSDAADALTESLDSAAAPNPELSEALAGLAEALASLEIRGAPSAGGEHGPEADAQRRQAWAQALASAASNDAARLATGLGESMAAIDSGLASAGGGAENPANRDPQASGTYDETLGPGGEGVLPDAIMRQVPPRYRDQTNAYFRRLAEPNPAEDRP